MATKPDRVSTNILNGRFDLVHNHIWQNSTANFRDTVPMYDSKGSLPRIGESLATNPGLWNEWIGGLMNEIGLKVIRSATFYNDFAPLQKGEVAYGEVIEEIFVGDAELRDFSVEKAAVRELKRSPANVHTAFHLTNFEGQYAVTTEWAYVKRAFQSEEGVMDLIDRIIASLSNSFEGDDRDMYLYSLHRRFLDGGIKQEVVTWNGTDLNQSAKNLTKGIRAMARRFANKSTEYNSSGVRTASKPEDLYIVIDADTEAELDVELLASAFNMDKAQILGHIIVLDDWDSVDEYRFDVLREATGSLLEYTVGEKAYLQAGKLKAIVFDASLFQVYSKDINLSNVLVHNGMMTNTFLNIMKVYGMSPFANAVAFVTEEYAPVSGPITFEITEKATNENFTSLSLQTDEAMIFAFDTSLGTNVTAGVLVIKEGGVMAPNGSDAVDLEFTVNGVRYELIDDNDDPTVLDVDTAEVGDTLTFAVKV